MGIFLGLRTRFWLRSVLLVGIAGVNVFATAAVLAKPSVLCPTLKATVANTGSVAIDVSHCDGPFDGGMSGPISPLAKQGLVTIGKNSRNVQRVTYKHKGNSATGDVFYLEDNDNGVVTVNITITKAKPKKS